MCGGPALMRSQSAWQALSLGGDNDQPIPADSKTFTTIDEAYCELDGAINLVKAFLNVDIDVAVGLLQYYKWDVQRILEAYFDTGSCKVC